jgi:hypothetical protein
MSFTSDCPLDDRKCPKDPFKFGRDIEHSQSYDLHGSHKILFNKGRYFETSIYDKDLREQVSKLAEIPIK